MEPCEWELERHSDWSLWNTICGNVFEFNEGGPEENGFAYCPYCGCALSVKASDPDDED
jgi:hypothetical protein